MSKPPMDYYMMEFVKERVNEEDWYNYDYESMRRGRSEKNVCILKGFNEDANKPYSEILYKEMEPWEEETVYVVYSIKGKLYKEKVTIFSITERCGSIHIRMRFFSKVLYSKEILVDVDCGYRTYNKDIKYGGEARYIEKTSYLDEGKSEPIEKIIFMVRARTLRDICGGSSDLMYITYTNRRPSGGKMICDIETGDVTEELMDLPIQ